MYMMCDTSARIGIWHHLFCDVVLHCITTFYYGLYSFVRDGVQSDGDIECIEGYYKEWKTLQGSQCWGVHQCGCLGDPLLLQYFANYSGASLVCFCYFMCCETTLAFPVLNMCSFWVGIQFISSLCLHFSLWVLCFSTICNSQIKSVFYYLWVTEEYRSMIFCTWSISSPPSPSSQKWTY